MSSYFPNRWPLSYLNLTKNMKTYIRHQQHKNFKHQDIKQKEPPQKYRLGMISNTKLLAGLIQILVRFCQFILGILSGKEILTSIKGRNSIKILQKMTGNNPKLNLVNVDVHTKFGQILSIRSQDIERKRNSDVNQGP